MDVDFFDSYPYRPLIPDLASLMRAAQRVDAAIAFVTRPGVAFLRQYLKTHPSAKTRLVASICFPTNLPELANLEDDYPGTVFLHTGFQSPVEPDGDRGQFHSKVVLMEMPGTERCVVIGSHNWTQKALQGYNMEAGMILRCQEDDPIVAQVRQHIEACATAPGTEPFSRQRLKFYETIQCDLYRRIGPRNTDSEDFPGFEPMDALVMHAEDATGTGIPNPFQVFIPVRDAVTSEFLLTHAEKPQVPRAVGFTTHSAEFASPLVALIRTVGWRGSRRRENGSRSSATHGVRRGHHACMVVVASPCGRPFPRRLPEGTAGSSTERP